MTGLTRGDDILIVTAWQRRWQGKLCIVCCAARKETSCVAHEYVVVRTYCRFSKRKNFSRYFVIAAVLSRYPSTRMHSHRR